MAMSASTCVGGLAIPSRPACVEASSTASANWVDRQISLYSHQSGLLFDQQSRHGVRCINAMPSRQQSCRHRRTSGSDSFSRGQRSSIFRGSKGTDLLAAVDLCRVSELASGRQVAVNAADGDQGFPTVNVEVKAGEGNDTSADQIPDSDLKSILSELRKALQAAQAKQSLARQKSLDTEERAQHVAEQALELKDAAKVAEAVAEEAVRKLQQAGETEVIARQALLGADGDFLMQEEALLELEASLQAALQDAVNASWDSASDSDTSTLREGSRKSPSSDSSSQPASYSTAEALQQHVASLQAAVRTAKEEVSRNEERLREAREQLQVAIERKVKAQQAASELREKAAAVKRQLEAAESEVAVRMSEAERAVRGEVDADRIVDAAIKAIKKAEEGIIIGGATELPAPDTTADASPSAQSPLQDSPSSPDQLPATVVLTGVTPSTSSDVFVVQGGLGSRPEPVPASDLPSLPGIVIPLAEAAGSQGGIAAVTATAAAAAASAAADVLAVGAGAAAPAATPPKSSQFFSASFFSAEGGEGEQLDSSAAAAVSWLERVVRAAQRKWLLGFQKAVKQPLVLGALVLAVGAAAFGVKTYVKSWPLPFSSSTVTVSPVTLTGSDVGVKPAQDVVETMEEGMKAALDGVKGLPANEEEAQLFDVLWLLLASVIFVPLFQKLPGGSPVLGYLAAGALIGPYSLSIIQHVHGTKALAEFGVVFLMFNIGLELSLERLRSMRKYVFGLGSAQVLVTAVIVGLLVHFVCGFTGPCAIVVGNGLALSSTAVVLQVLQERGESTSRHGRATFSVLLFQDLAVVVLLILIPLLAPSSGKGVGFSAIAEALALAAVKAVVAITAIIAGGRLLLRPIYRNMAENHNAEIFAATTLLVVLGTSVLTARAGLSMALGAFLAGLLLAETEFALQVESDITPYRGLLLGLFFMTVGMSIDPKLLVAHFPLILGAIVALVAGKTAILTAVGPAFGLSSVAATRAGLLLAPGGEFAFVAFGEAVQKGIMDPRLSSMLFLVVGLSMAVTPWLAAVGQILASKFDQQDVRSLEPQEAETDDLQGHIIICGFGRVGQIIAQLLSERLIPFVALDVQTDRVAAGRALDVPVFFGDAGSRDVLHKVGAERAAAAVITLDTPGANYRTVWALSKNFPHVKTFVRAHDVDHGITLEKAGATAVVPETLEPSLQLAAAVLAMAKLPASEIAATLDDFRFRHLAELTELSTMSGSSLGYGYARGPGKRGAKPPPPSPPSSPLQGNGSLAWDDGSGDVAAVLPPN